MLLNNFVFYYSSMCLYLKNSGLWVWEKYFRLHTGFVVCTSRLLFQWLLGPLFRNHWFSLTFLNCHTFLTIIFIHNSKVTCDFKTLFCAPTFKFCSVQLYKFIFIKVLNKLSDMFISSFSRTENFLCIQIPWCVCISWLFLYVIYMHFFLDFF